MIKLSDILLELLSEKKLCPKGRAYYNRRIAAGEKPSAYLSGRAVKVCKGLMEGDEEIVKCENCGWEWSLEDGGKEPYTCHKCGHDNSLLKEDQYNDTSKFDLVKQNPFDIQKLVDKGIIFVTKPGDGKGGTAEPNWEGDASIITLYNMSNAEPWMKEAVKTPLPKAISYIQKDQNKLLYNGKYNQILWGIKKKGLKPENFYLNVNESLRDWFEKEDWVRIDTQGNITGPCGTMKKGKATTRCLPRAKANRLTKAERAATARKKVAGSKKGKQFVANTEKAKVRLREDFTHEIPNSDFGKMTNILNDKSKADQIHSLLVQMFLNQKESILEAKYEDIAVIPAKGVQRGTSESGAKSFNINIGNIDVIKKMAKTPMGSAGSAKSFSYEGPGGKTFTDFSWKGDTSQWDVWKNMNYITLTPENYVHWYHGKMPGGSFKDDKTGNLNPGSTGTPLPDLTVDRFGFKVYKALLSEPSVGHIQSDKSSTPAVKKSVYANLMKDNNLVWISAGGTGGLDYDKLMVINPSYADKNKLKQQFEKENSGKKIYTSNNF